MDAFVFEAVLEFLGEGLDAYAPVRALLVECPVTPFNGTYTQEEASTEYRRDVDVMRNWARAAIVIDVLCIMVTLYKVCTKKRVGWFGSVVMAADTVAVAVITAKMQKIYDSLHGVVALAVLNLILSFYLGFRQCRDARNIVKKSVEKQQEEVRKNAHFDDDPWIYHLLCCHESAQEKLEKAVRKVDEDAGWKRKVIYLALIVNIGASIAIVGLGTAEYSGIKSYRCTQSA